MSLMENHSEYIGSDFSDVLSLACQLNPPRDFILPNMYRYALDKRQEHSMRKMGRLDETESTLSKKEKLQEKLKQSRKKDIQIIKQNFYSRFSLLQGLAKLRNLKDYNKRENLF